MNSSNKLSPILHFIILYIKYFTNIFWRYFSNEKLFKLIVSYIRLKECIFMIYKCSVCGYIHNEEETGVLIKDLDCCPICKQPIDKFVEIKISQEDNTHELSSSDLAYAQEYAKSDENVRYMDCCFR